MSPGVVAQLGERRVRNAEVEGSIPFRSIRRKSDASDPRILIQRLRLTFRLRISLLLGYVNRPKWDRGALGHHFH